MKSKGLREKKEKSDISQILQKSGKFENEYDGMNTRIREREKLK